MINANTGANALAAVLSERMKKEGTSPMVLDFGTIGSDYSLRTNTFPIDIPRGGYTICRMAAGMDIEVSGETNNSVATVGGIAPGSRVLVAWVGNEAVVIDVIVSS